MVADDGPGPFEWWSHPVRQDGRHTLAWARMDVDLDAGEALIEEIQSDWIREAVSEWRRSRQVKDRQAFLYWLGRYLGGAPRHPREFDRYISNLPFR